MDSLERSVAMAAGLAVFAANLAAAHATPDGIQDEDAELTFAQGDTGEHIARLVAGEVDGKGVVIVEYYVGASLRFAVPYTQVLIDGEERSVRELRGLAAGRLGKHGFALAADLGTKRMQCTVHLWADTAVSCRRDPAWVPPGDPACVRAFEGNIGRTQCTGLRNIFAKSAFDHDELLRLCTDAFRVETFRTDCLRYGYNNEPPLFRETLAACVAAYRTQDERKFCTFYSFAPANKAERPSVDAIRTCDRKHDDDRATTDCVFEQHTGAKQIHPRSRTTLPSDVPTEPVTASSVKARERGGRIDVSTGKWRELSLRATGGMVGSEPVLWVDAFAADGKLRWMQPVDRIVLGKRVRALREVTALDRVKLRGDVLTFRAVHRGKSLQCRADATAMFARCR